MLRKSTFCLLTEYLNLWNRSLNLEVQFNEVENIWHTHKIKITQTLMHGYNFHLELKFKTRCIELLWIGWNWNTYLVKTQWLSLTLKQFIPSFKQSLYLYVICIDSFIKQKDYLALSSLYSSFCLKEYIFYTNNI